MHVHQSSTHTFSRCTFSTPEGFAKVTVAILVQSFSTRAPPRTDASSLFILAHAEIVHGYDAADFRYTFNQDD